MTTIEKLAKADKKNTVTRKSGELKSMSIQHLNSMREVSGKIYYSHYTGSGRHIRLVSGYCTIKNSLTLLGYKFTQGNDAPRGGRNGDYIKCSSVAIKALRSLLK